MEDNAKLSDLIKKVRADELHHSKINLSMLTAIHI